jgi:hypothetical protein
MDIRPNAMQPLRCSISLLLASLLLQGCMTQWGAELQMDSKSQILMSESSQVRLRAIQSRVFDTTDRLKIMHAVVAAMQDLYFKVDVLDEELGVISGKKLYHEDDDPITDATYIRYKTDELIIFNTNFRTWGPFDYRNDLTRITVTVRPKEETRSLVRASVQYEIRAVEDPEMYQKFFRVLEQSLFLSAQRDEAP